MIITRTPLRISIGGGGTDLPSYYRRRGGSLVSAAIDKYIYISVNHTFTDDYFLKYSDLERVTTVNDIRHPIMKEALQMHDAGPGIEVVSMADIPAGTGLGSSGSFTVGLLRALYAYRREPVLNSDLAAEACQIEIERLGEPVGKQDQYVAAFGGLTAFDFHQDDSVTVESVAASDSVLRELEDHLLLFFTGYAREASQMLSDQAQKSDAGDEAMLSNLDQTKALGWEIRKALEAGQLVRFGELLHEHWLAKRSRSSGMSNEDIDRWYDLARSNGAIGGKLVGAGAGGFLMFLTEDPVRLRRALAESGLEEVRFRFDHLGCEVLTVG